MIMMALSQQNHHQFNHKHNHHHHHHHERHYRSKSTPSDGTLQPQPPPSPPQPNTRRTSMKLPVIDGCGVICNNNNNNSNITNDSRTTSKNRALQYHNQSSTPTTNNITNNNTFNRMSTPRTSSSSSASLLLSSSLFNDQIPTTTTTRTSCSSNSSSSHRHKSPFTRGQSRVFYASEVGMWDYGTERKSSPPPPQPPHTTPTSSLSGSGQFRRSDHRSNSSYKSQDSGFSDSGCGGVGGGGGEIVSGTTNNVEDSSKVTNEVYEQRKTDDNHHHHHSPVKKLAKWSSSTKSPLKMLWRQQDGSKLSVLKCCAGMNPLFPFYHHKQIKSSERDLHETSTEIHFSPNQNNNINNDKNGREKFGSSDSLSKDESRRKMSSVSNSNVNNTGTWPRVRKTTTVHCQDVSDPKVLPSSSSSAPHKFGTYYSTRLKGHQKPRVLFQENNCDKNKQDVGLHNSQSHFRDTLFVRNSSVQLWLRDLHWSTEVECMNTLQSKAVARDLADVSVISTRNANGWKIDKKLLKCALNGCDDISLNVRSLLSDCRSQQFKDVPAVQKYLRLVFAHCGILKQLLDRIKKDDTSSTTCDAPSPLDAHFALETAFDNLFDALILCHLKVIVDTLDDPLSVLSVKTAVTCIGLLGAHDNVLCHLIAKTGAIRSLLTICIERKYRSIRSLILRSLAMLCCNDESIRELEESGGIECITEILAEKDANEAEKCEAAGVVAQITSPLLDNNPTVMGLTENIPALIQSLTDLAGSTKSYEGFLLSTAAIGNLTFMATNACEHLHECKTTFVLISACRQGKKKSESVFVKDQVATILANMASVPKGRDDIIQSGGLVVLLCFLQIRPSMVQSKAEVAACERVQQKSAIALSRLCSDVKIAEQVVSLQGVQRLVRLCKDEKERNESDAVLVACLAVLRKIASVCGLEEFKDLDATELVEPRLLDSFLIYSSRQESYV